MRAWRVLTAGVWLLSGLFAGYSASAATPQNGNFSLQVSPSPIVTTVKPGEAKEVELKIRNTSTAPEELKIEARSFRYDTLSGEVLLDDTTPPDISRWIAFSAPTFTVRQGEWYTQKITFNLPAETGFSYSFALLIARKDNPTPTGSDGRLLKGSVAVFTLVNVDRPGATRSLELKDVEISQSVYEYLPATVDIRLRNSGNTIVQPYGNVYIQRNSEDSRTLATLSANDSRAYLLPGTERSLKVSWTNGFPLYRTSSGADGKTKTTLEWNWGNLSQFRFGQYTAKVVVVYNDGTRDIPIMGEVTFWVIPWKAMLTVLAGIIIFILLLRFYIRRRTEKAVAKALKMQKKA